MNNTVLPTKDADKICCIKCGKTLSMKKWRGVEIKCSRCGTLNTILEQMIEQVIITDKEGRILFVNKAVEETTGYSLHEVVGKKPSEVWGGHMPKEFYKEMWDTILKKKNSAKMKITNKKKTGEMYDIWLLVSPIFDTKGETIFYVGIEIVI